jgi:hypothetical protein
MQFGNPEAGIDELFVDTTEGRRGDGRRRRRASGAAGEAVTNLYEFEQLEPRILLSASDPLQAADPALSDDLGSSIVVEADPADELLEGIGTDSDLFEADAGEDLLEGGEGVEGEVAMTSEGEVETVAEALSTTASTDLEGAILLKEAAPSEPDLSDPMVEQMVETLHAANGPPAGTSGQLDHRDILAPTLGPDPCFEFDALPHQNDLTLRADPENPLL